MPKLGRKWLTAAGALLALACLLFFSLRIAALMAEGELEIRNSLHLLPAALAVFIAAYAAFACGWHALLAAMGIRTPLRTSAAVFATTQFGKYLPGNVGHHVGRVTLAARFGMPGYGVLATMVVEMGLVVACMLVLGLPLLEFWLDRTGLDGSDMALALAVVACACVVAAGLLYRLRGKPLVARLVEPFAELAGRGPRAWGLLTVAAALILAGILASALSLAMLDPTRHLTAPAALPLVFGLFATAWLLGFVTPGAPAGIGIREVVLAEGLAPLIGHAQAVSVALSFRFLSTAADLLVFLAGLGLLWRVRRDRRS